ncbi:homoserine kinase [Pseudomonas saliphila]|uniref:homoserine kinase n=1 Tax=Pseudomonas saliphila TaxID=2586906 RepID=UPI00123A357A|nr:homoserine kinase [Pseudomonas saliphila]
MSVFTPVERTQLDKFISGFDLGRLIDYSGIVGGTENSNFFVATERGEYVLTLVERGPIKDLPFFIELLDCLRQADLPVPYAIRDRNGEALHQLCGRPALLQPRLPGAHVEHPDASHCHAVGQALARLHEASAGSGLQRRSDRGLDWMLTHGQRLRSRISDPVALTLVDQLQARIQRWQTQPPELPAAILHADLFRDNILFDGHHLSGLIDFYNAASGWALYDVAICVNDWCLDQQEQLHPARTQALLAGYASIRRFNPAEAEAWPDTLRLAALRFWLSRQLAADQHEGQEGVLVKDTEHFLRVLRNHQTVSIGLPLAL